MEHMIGILMTLMGGFIGKRVGKSEKVGRGRELQKVLGPAAAIAAAAGYQMVTGDSDGAMKMIVDTGTLSAQGIALYSVAKNAVQMVTASR